jgi:L-iditol 2-dehydrogenase
MKALVKYEAGVGNVEVREVDEPACGDDQVKIEVVFCGICGTDLHVYHDTFPNYPPVIMGHKFAGTIAEVGRRVSHLRPGDRVTVLPASAVICGVCIYCRTGRFMFCPQRRGMGHGVNGALARYAVVRKDQVYKVPQRLTLEEAALCEPLAAAIQPVLELSSIGTGDVVLISGPGPIGLMCLKLLVAEGIKTIVACTSRDGVRAEAARSIGAAVVVNVEHQDLGQVVSAETGGAGVDFAFECAGAAASAAGCLAALRPLGTFTQVGIYGRKPEFDLDTVIYKQLHVKGSVGYTLETWQRLIRILEQARLCLGDLVTHKFPLRRWKEAFDVCARREGIKVLISPED